MCMSLWWVVHVHRAQWLPQPQRTMVCPVPAYDTSMAPREFVESMRKQHKLIMGIGHMVKSITNPDMRVTLIKVVATAGVLASLCLSVVRFAGR